MKWPTLFTAVLATASVGWTTDNEALDTPVFDRELAGLTRGCDDIASGCGDSDTAVLTHWMGRTPTGNLYLLLQNDCNTAADCGAWLVERTASGADLRLNIEGRFRLVHKGASVPEVETWREQADGQAVLTRYAWVAGAFLKVETRTVYQVDGVVCGSALECHQAATAAHAQRKSDKALRIWEQVHKVSWI